MNASSLSYHTVNEILSDALLKAGDKKMKYMSEGYYTSQIQRALQELSFDSFFQKKEVSFDLNPECREVVMPKGCFNLLEVFAYNGECRPENGVLVWYKRGFTGNVLARDQWNNDKDSFYPTRGNGGPPSDLFFFGVRNGVLHFSESCKPYSKVLLRFNGLICDPGENPCVPMFFREAVIDFVAKQSLIARIGDEDTPTEMISRWQFLLNEVKASMDMPHTGTWAEAIYRAKNLDNKLRRDMAEYMMRLDY